MGKLSGQQVLWRIVAAASALGVVTAAAAWFQARSMVRGIDGLASLVHSRVDTVAAHADYPVLRGADTVAIVAW